MLSFQTAPLALPARHCAHLDALPAALDAMDTPAVLALLTEDCFFQAGNAPPVTGKEQIGNGLDAFFRSVKAIRHQLDDRFEAGGTAVHRGQVTYTRHNGSTLTVPVCDVFKLEGDKIKEYYIYIDWSAL
jgi:ketosteroid isomerase-like protein